MDRDCWPTFWEHNQPLFESMIEKGRKFIVRDKRGFFVDTFGEYVDFPVGYITGVSFSGYDNPYPFYASIKGVDGWLQRSFATRQETLDWAIETLSRINQAI